MHWPLQLFNQNYGLSSHTNHVVCVHFISEWLYLQFNVNFERKIFEKLFHGGFILLWRHILQLAVRLGLVKGNCKDKFEVTIPKVVYDMASSNIKWPLNVKASQITSISLATHNNEKHLSHHQNLPFG